MTNLSDLTPSGKPKRILRLSGAGTYIPTQDNARCFVRLMGGGGGGGGGRGGAGSSDDAAYCGGGGGAALYTDRWLTIPIGGISYSVGAAGLGGAAGAASGGNGGAGSRSIFGPVIALGGANGMGANVRAGGYGGVGNGVNISSTAPGSAVSGGGGGTGGYNNSGALADETASVASGYVAGINGVSASNGGGAGGDSALGIGGVGGSISFGAAQTNTTAGGLGAGGGGGGGATVTKPAAGIPSFGKDGGAGLIEVWDYGV